MYSSTPIDGSNLNPILQMVTWLLLAITSLMFGLRLLTRFFIKTGKSFSREDAFIIFSFLFGIGESVTLVLPQSKILGKDLSKISPNELEDGLKADYAAEILVQLALGFAKLSVCQSFLIISPARGHRLAIWVITVILVVIMLSSSFGTVFQCGIQDSWAYRSRHCINFFAFHMYEGVANIVTDIVLVIVAIVVFLPLKMALKSRLIVIGFYASRLLVVGVAVLQLTYVRLRSEDNFTLRAFPYYITRQVIQFASITSACVVYFWPFMQSIQSGLLGLDNAGRSSQYQLARSFIHRGSDSGLGRLRESEFANSIRQSDHFEIDTDDDYASLRISELSSRQGLELI
ncbi:hypothetical protein F5Y07DRAFT_398094 [Xylaria sp. FL0933]|nr:hypothetical protein F5Y07DRAFT_398094 [Xylaria sp. FL0933]